jgi:lipopolysaccharide biosynthesis glycosyltransferase
VLEIYTVTDEGYVPGVIALVNSLRQNEFSGPIHIGSPEQLSIGAAPNIYLHVLGRSSFSPTHRKAELLLAHPSEHFVYLDADTIVANRTLIPRLEKWIRDAFVCSFEAIIPSMDYRRFGWAKRLELPREPNKWPHFYFNAGFFAGVMDRDYNLLEAWDRSSRKAIVPPGSAFTDPDLPFLEQDVLNGLLQDRRNTIGIGPPDVWYAATPINPFLSFGAFNGPAVLHCTGPSKPWKLAKPPNHSPNIYEQRWFDYAIKKPNPLSLSVSIPKAVSAWLENGRAARASARLRRLRKRILSF